MEVTLGGLAFRVDHVAFATPDLEGAMGVLADRGLGHTPVGLARWPTEEGPEKARTLSAVLEDGYLDVIELTPPPGFEAPGDHVLIATGILLTSHDLEDSRRQLESNGISCNPSYTIVRRFASMPEADQTYRIFTLSLRHAGGLPLGIIETRATQPMRNRAEDPSPTHDLRSGSAALGVSIPD